MKKLKLSAEYAVYVAMQRNLKIAFQFITTIINISGHDQSIYNILIPNLLYSNTKHYVLAGPF